MHDAIVFRPSYPIAPPTLDVTQGDDGQQHRAADPSSAIIEENISSTPLLAELHRKAEQCPVLGGRPLVLRLFSAEGQRGLHPAVLTAGDVLDALDAPL